MDFLDPKKKRAHNIRLLIGYLLMAIALAIGTWILAIQTNGYNYDPKTGKVVQSGLVFVDAHPESATVYIDGQQKNQTDTRLVIPAGEHTLELKRDGYRSWQRQFEVGGSSIVRFAYPFLFPVNLVTRDLQLYSTSPGLATETPDRHWLLIQQPGSLTNFDAVDLINKTNPVTPLTLPNNLFSAIGGNHALELVEWSTDNRHVLVKHVFDGGQEFAVIDRETPAASININRLFEIPITSMTLRDKKFDQYYILDANGGVLRRADARNQQLTPILTRVLAFRPHGADVILYVTDENSAAGKAAVRIWDNEKIYNLRQLPVSKRYLIDVARFDGRWYMAAGDDTEQKIYIYRDPFTELKRTPARPALPLSVLKVASAEYISFSANARFIAVQGGSEFAVYDAENNDQFRYNTRLTLGPSHKAEWMDGHRLVLTSENKVVVFDFDGTNKQILSAAEPSYSVFFDRDYSALFAISKSQVVNSRPALTRTELRVLPKP